MHPFKLPVYAAFAVALLLAIPRSTHAAGSATDSDYYTEPPVFNLRPDPKSESNFGIVGVTGLKLRVYPGVVLKVEGTVPGSPAEGKFAKGEIVSGVNGVAHKGRNPYVVFGQALTHAEATDGKLVFDVLSTDGKEKKVALEIPVLGAYSPTWPLDCKKSQAIVKQAAEFYAKNEKGGVEGGLRCLFLLSTGDDQYLPAVKTYLNKLGANVKGIGDCTWSRGYNGLACAEYYLRTGDESVLPLLKHICEDAISGQAYGISWAHGTHRCNPGYMDGIMNAAAIQLLTTLLLSKECGIDVDERALIGSLTFYYRFAGHGAVAYGDHRPECLGSNGKDGMAAAAMQIASEAEGDVSIYRKARDAFAMPMLDSYPDMIRGHADDGRGDAIWRGIAITYLKDSMPAAYQSHMDRTQWWYDLTRRPSGGFGLSSCQAFDDEASGAAAALAYTAPLKTLRITGAPRSKYAKSFTLPTHLWGRKADLDFLSIQNGESFSKYGADEPIHVTLSKVSDDARRSAAEFAKVPREDLLKNVYHRSYFIRAQAAKGLFAVGALDELERLLQDPDVRARRAAMDGMLDWNYFFGMGNNRIRADKITPGMLASLRKMLSDPEEAIAVVDGALMVLSCASPAEIDKSLSLIMPWTTSDEWWIRQSAFAALAAAAEDESIAPKVLPTLGEMLCREDRPVARGSMNTKLSQLTRKQKPDSSEGKQLAAMFVKAVDETRIDPGFRGGAGGFYVKAAFTSLVDTDPASGLGLAESVGKRIREIRTDYLLDMTNKLLGLREKLPLADQEALAEILFKDYRQEFLRRMNAGEEISLDLLASLAQLKDKNAGWKLLATQPTADQEWRYITFAPLPKDELDVREGRRLRDVTLPDELNNWYAPDFDDKAWKTGKAPIGVGKWTGALDAYGPGDPNNTFSNRSDWGDGEFLLMRTEFTVDSLDYDLVRLRILAKQGCKIYLNGQPISSFGGGGNTPGYKPKMLDPNERKLLKQGKNTLAVYTVVQFYEGLPPMRRRQLVNTPRLGQMDVYLEGLNKADILTPAGTN